MQIKKTIIKLFLLLLLGNLTLPINAQQTLGFKGGYNISTSEFNFGNTGFYVVDRIDLLTLSIFAEFEKNNFFSFYPTVHFVQRGNIQRRLDSDFLLNENIINYVGVSLLSKLSFVKEKYEIYGLLGPQVDYAINARLIEKTEPKVKRSNIDFETSDLSRIDMNVQTGLGVAKVNAHYKIILEMTYDLPFYDINKSEEVTQKNLRNIGLHLGLAFLLAR